MKTTRKQFLSTAATGLAAAAFGLPRAAFGASKPGELQAAAFQSLVGSPYRIVSGPAGIDSDLNLHGVADRTPAAVKGAPSLTTQFILTFSFDGPRLPQGIYWLRQGTGDTVPMFLQPAGSAPGAISLYRAEFNILKKTGGRG